jgi:glycosyltransferase involved in cell wall biosynthesis
MKILVNAISARMGGIVTYTRNLLASLNERKVDSTFAVSARFPDQGPGVLRLAASDLRPLRRFLWEQTAWRAMVKRLAPDVLFSSANFGLIRSPVPQVLLVREGGLFDPFYLANCTPEQGPVAGLQRGIRRRLIISSARNSDLVLTPTATMREMLVAWAPDLQDKVEVNSYGTLSDAFTPAREAPRAWRGDGTLRLLYVSVYYPHKQPGLVCQAVRGLLAEGMETRATITMSLAETRDFLGGVHDHILLRKAEAEGLVELGRRRYEDLPSLYHGHDVFVFPSISETFGHPMVEALSSGLPVVAADTPVNREVCGDAALYFDPLRPSALVECIRRLDGDAELRGRMVRMGRERVVQAFTWASHVDRLIAIFERVAAGRRP